MALLAQFGGDDAGIERIEMDTGCSRSLLAGHPRSQLSADVVVAFG